MTIWEADMLILCVWASIAAWLYFGRGGFARVAVACAVLFVVGCGGTSLEQPSAPEPTRAQTAEAYRLVWENALDMRAYAAPMTTWTLAGDDELTPDGHLFARWHGSFANSPNWVDDLLMFRHDASADRNQRQFTAAMVALIDAGL